MTITLPVPGKALRPNDGNPHWRTKHSAAKRAKARARLQTLPHPVEERARPWRGYSIHAYTAALWDRDNILAASKAYLDGIAGALGANDRDWDLIGDPAIQRTIDRANPRFEITLHPATPTQ